MSLEEKLRLAPPEKFCRKCRETKDRAKDFFNNSATYDGKTHYCKKCTMKGQAGRRERGYRSRFDEEE